MRRILAGDGPRLDGDRFSLIDGDPLFELERAVHLAGGRHAVLVRAVALALIGWLPPVVIAVISRDPHSVLVPLDVRFLFAIPVLLWAEGFVDTRVREAVASFTARSLIAPSDKPRFARIVDHAARLHRSPLAAAAIVALAFSISFSDSLLSRRFHGLGFGPWIRWLSLPLYRFVLLQWMWRWLVWAILLGRIARLDLQLTATHPDLAGGLGFLEHPGLAFAVLQIANGAVIASQLSRKVGVAGQQIVGVALICIVVTLGPLALFARRLVRAKRLGRLEYGRLASQHNRLFAEQHATTPEEQLLGDPTISSLADMGTSYSVIDRMRPLPVGRQTLVVIALVSAAPALPLLLTHVSVREMLLRAVKTVLL
jgi:hypothetical protein